MLGSEGGRGVSPFTIRLFGPPEVRVAGEPLPPLRSRKGYGLLALLALRHGSEVQRSWVAGMLWPDSPEPHAMASLRKSLKDLRRALGSAAGRLGSPKLHTLALDLTGAVADVVAFDQAIARGDSASLEEAVSLYRGPLLEGWVEEYVFQERQVREEAYLRALETLAAAARERGDLTGTEHHLRRAVTVDPTREGLQRALMELLSARGEYAGAIQTYRDLRLRLHDELNAEPAPETSALFQRIRAAARSKATLDAQRGLTLDAQRSTLGSADAQSVVVGAESQASSVERQPASCAERGSEATFTFLFTDVEGSTRLWEEHPEATRAALARHDTLLRDAIEGRGGTVFKTIGDQFCAAFATAADALGAALAGQRALLAETWAETGPLRVRMAVHTGTAEARAGDYYGPPLNRVSRLLAAGRGGQILLSLVTEELVRDHLPEGVSLRDLREHTLKDLARPERVFQLVAPDLPQEFAPLNTLEVRRQDLPVPSTPLVGRERESATLQAMLREGARLVTLTGPGGTGKTRLGLHVAAELLDDFADGVCFVELVSITDSGLVVASIAHALGVREEGGRPLLEGLKEAVRERQLLLVLDNFEHVLAAAPSVAELLSVAPRLKVLVTSRAGLHLRGEREYPVLPLALPDLSHLPTAAALSQYAAVELFIQRALAVKPEFAVTNENAPSVAEICTRLDGLPLAIELAAARVKMLPPRALLSRLSSRLQLLTGGARDLSPRQQTLRGAIAWSHDLLEEGERAVFRRLAVFAGGCTLEAAEAVCSDPEGRRQKAEGSSDVEEGRRQKAASSPDGLSLPSAFCLLPSDVLDLLASLVDKSLLRQEEAAGGDARFVMLETIREYGLEQLAASGELAALRGQHARLFLGLAESAESELRGAGQGDWLERLETEHNNLRSALEWSVGRGEAETALRLAAALWRFWHMHGYLGEGRLRLEAALAMPGGSERTLGRARALNGAGALAHDQGDARAAVTLHEESLVIARERGDAETVATALNHLGNAALDLKQCDRAGASYQEALGLWRQLGNQQGAALALNNLGSLHQIQGNSDQAVAHFEESLALKRRLQDPRGIASSLNNLGYLAIERRDYAQAARLLDESLRLFRQLGYLSGCAATLDNLADLAVEEGELERAAVLYRESLGLWMQLQNRPAMAAGLEKLGGTADRLGQTQPAARLFGAAEALREAAGNPGSSPAGATLEPCVAHVRAVLGDEAFTAAWAEGRAMTVEQLLDSVEVPR